MQCCALPTCRQAVAIICQQLIQIRCYARWHSWIGCCGSYQKLVNPVTCDSPATNPEVGGPKILRGDTRWSSQLKFAISVKLGEISSHIRLPAIFNRTFILFSRAVSVREISGIDTTVFFISPPSFVKKIDKSLVVSKVWFFVHFTCSRRQGVPVKNFPHPSFYSRQYTTTATSWYMKIVIIHCVERGTHKNIIK